MHAAVQATVIAHVKAAAIKAAWFVAFAVMFLGACAWFMLAAYNFFGPWAYAIALVSLCAAVITLTTKLLPS